MKLNLCMALVAATALAVIMPNASAWAQSAAPKGDVEKGHKLYVADGCYACHGIGAQGGGRAGPRLAKTKLPFDAFLQQLRHPSNAMPPYEAPILSDQVAADIFAYLKSLPGPVDMEKVNLPH
jgi:mono/diheme cytochrome c family protein